MNRIEELYNGIVKGNRKTVQEQVQLALEGGTEPKQILFGTMIPAIREIGDRFSRGEAFVPEMLVGARAMQAGLQILNPLMQKAGQQPLGRVAIGTVKGDLHDIGKNLVRMMMEGKGLEVIDLGTDVPPEMFIQAAIEHNSQVICCSALLTTTMGAIKDVITAMKAAGIRDSVKIMIGGAPITQAFCDQIGADCYMPDATSAALAAVELCKAS